MARWRTSNQRPPRPGPEGLSEPYRATVEYGIRYLVCNQRTPSHREFADALGVSHQAVAKRLQVLERAGYVECRYDDNVRILRLSDGTPLTLALAVTPPEG